jgi:phosphatidylglycerol:prolipoprotein diacylglycerol transferase
MVDDHFEFCNAAGWVNPLLAAVIFFGEYTMPDSIHIGSFTIHFYGIIIMIGVIAATYLAQREANRSGQDGNLVWDLLIWVLVAGIIGARIWHIFTPMPDLVKQGITPWFYLTHPLDAIAIWKGGLGIPGAVIGGVMALFLFARKKNLPFALWLDLLAAPLALGQAIGRWGNFFNQELYGAPTTLPWAIFIDPQHRYAGYETVAYYHPLFLYESLWNLANMALLLWLWRRYRAQLHSGDIFLIYLVVYPVGRFLLEFLRMDASQVAGINANQAVMGVVAIFAIVILAVRHTRNRLLVDSSH